MAWYLIKHKHNFAFDWLTVRSVMLPVYSQLACHVAETVPTAVLGRDFILRFPYHSSAQSWDVPAGNDVLGSGSSGFCLARSHSWNVKSRQAHSRLLTEETEGSYKHKKCNRPSVFSLLKSVQKHGLIMLVSS
jgi:hypothetical protein